MDSNKIIEINVKDLLFALLRKSWIIILVGIICAAGGRYYSKYYLVPIYTSSAKIYISSQEEGQVTTLSDIQIGTYLTKDYMILIKSRPVAEEVIERLNLNISSGQLISLISVYTPEDSRVLQISVSYFDQYMVKVLVDTIAEVSAERMKHIMGLEQANILEDGYYPYGPSGPDVRRNTMLAGCSGLLAASIIIILFFLFNDSIKSEEDIEKHLGLTTLGYIPIEVSVKKKLKRGKGKKAA